MSVSLHYLQYTGEVTPFVQENCELNLSTLPYFSTDLLIY